MNIQNLYNNISKSILGCLTIFTTYAYGQSSSFSEGAKVFNDNCSRCHLARPADHYTPKRWPTVISHMRNKAHLTKSEAMAVTDFLKSNLQTTGHNTNQPTIISTADNPQDIISKYACNSCHSIHGNGGTLGPNLNDSLIKRGENYIRQKIQNPKLDNKDSVMPKFPISDQEINALIMYLKKN